MVGKIINQKGITMAMLIVTIIIMLILAGVSINVIVNDDFFGRAEDMNKMNNQAINTAHKAEEDLLKQDVEEFEVDEGLEYGFIEAYEYVKVLDENGNNIKDSDGKDFMKLEPIQKSLSRYIEEKNGEATIYFKIAATNDKNLLYEAVKDDGNPITNQKQCYEHAKNVTYNKDGEAIPVMNVAIVEANEYLDYEYCNTILEVKLKVKSPIDDLSNLTIRAKKNNGTQEASLTFMRQTQESTAKTIYIPSGRSDITLESLTDGVLNINNTDTKILKDQASSNIWNEEEWDWLSKEYIVKIPTDTSTSQKAKLSGKTCTNMEGEGCKVAEFGGKIVINTSNVIETTVGKHTKLYIVQEIENENDKIVYMDDVKLEVYNPIEDFEFSGPYYISPLVENQELKLNTGDAFAKKCEIVKENSILPSELNISISGTKISSKVKDGATMPEKIDAEIKIKFNVLDYGGMPSECDGKIFMKHDNFTVLANDDPAITENFGTLAKAVEKASEFVDIGMKNIIIQQNTNGLQKENGSYEGYRIEDELYTLEDTQNENNNLYTYKAYFDINHLGLNGVTYDLNGNNLLFEWSKNDGKDREVRLKIGKDVTFNLKSSSDNDASTVHTNGEMIFNFKTTFQKNATFKYISFDSFVSTPKFAKYKTMTSFIESRETEGAKWYHYLYYTPIYINYFLIDFKVYWNSLNVSAVQNIDYERNVEAVENYGTFNFHSGCIRLESDEHVRSFGAWDGGIVLNIAEGFLQTLRGWGLEIASITDYVGGFAKLMHTGAGIKNYGEVILGDREGEGGITSENIPYPEISVKLKSEEEGIGITVGSVVNPNQSITRTYGVWNANSNAVTEMNSGFIEMIIDNVTNNWVSLGVGRAYGIFNDWGTTHFNGLTKKNIRRQLDYYGLGNIVEQFKVDLKDKKLTELINGVASEVSDIRDKILTTKFEGFFTFSKQQVIYELTGGATVVYTNSYAVANADGRPVYRDESAGDDGIIFGEKFSLEEVSFEAPVLTLNNQDNITTMNTLIPVKYYYRLYDTVGDPERKNGMDYHDNTHQKIFNPLNELSRKIVGFEIEGLTGSLVGSGINALNNLAFSSWIGQDFADTDVLGSLIKLAARSVGQTIRQYFKF